jgi:D-alanyl-D-alanine carboxypeptidase
MLSILHTIKPVPDPRSGGTTLAALFAVVALLLGSFAAANAAAAGGRPPRSGDPLEQAVKTMLSDLERSARIPGASVAIVLPGGCVRTFVTGVSDRAARTPMTAQTRFLAGSIGKSFVAAVAIDLANDGLWSLDDPVERYLGRETWFERLPNAHGLTLRMLLNHSSGLANHVDDPAFQRLMIEGIRANPEFVPTHESLVAYVLDRPPLSAPGAGYHYSDTNYILIGMAIERASGRTVYDLVQTRLLTPLRLRSTAPSDHRRLERLATGYWDPPDNYFELPTDASVADGALAYNPALEWTGGGFASTATDLARWMWLLHTGQALPTPYADELYVANPFPPDPRGTRYALAVAIWQTPAGKLYGHSGAIPGYQSFAAYAPKHDLAFAVLVNKQMDLTPVALRLYEEIARTTTPAHGRRQRPGDR